MNLTEKIAEFVRSKPDSIAIYHPQFTVSWRQLNDLIDTHASLLASQGIQGDHVAGIFHSKPLINLITSLALMKLGVPFIDITGSEPDFERIKEKLSMTHVITDKAQQFPGLKSILVDKLMIESKSIESMIFPTIRKGETAFFVKTSGTTTGISKYLSMTYENLFNRLNSYSIRSGSVESGGEIFWTPISISFTSSKLRYLNALMNGSSIIMGIGLSDRGVNYLNEVQATQIYCTPSQLHRFLEIGIPLNKIKSIEAGTTFVSEALRSEFKKKITKNLYIVYGATETGPVTLADPLLQLKSPNTVGVPYSGADIQIVDENDCPVPSGTSGLVRIKSPGMCVSYFKDTSSNQKAFRDGWFYPGDLGYLDSESSLILLGRSDDMMIFDGVNIHPTEIENVLSSHPALIEVLAFSVNHIKYGDVPVAAAVRRNSVSELELMKFCSEKLSYRTPKRIIFVDSFPRNDMGKVLRSDLPDFFAKELKDVI
jgi:acyl-coenzyme A synthetase/AMP-(fatty) acid ligase